MNRRRLIQSAAALAAGLILPPTLAENVEATRRYWSLDRTMLDSDWYVTKRFDFEMPGWDIIINGERYPVAPPTYSELNMYKMLSAITGAPTRHYVPQRFSLEFLP